MQRRERLPHLGEKEREIWSDRLAREAARRPLFALFFSVFLCRVVLATAFQPKMISALAPVRPASHKKRFPFDAPDSRSVVLTPSGTIDFF